MPNGLRRHTRAGTGDVGAILRRRERIVLALGSVGHELRPEIVIAEDPPLDEEHLIDTRRMLAKPDTTFVWVDGEDPELESTLHRFKELR